jgi:hypothetical protein
MCTTASFAFDAAAHKKRNTADFARLGMTHNIQAFYNTRHSALLCQKSSSNIQIRLQVEHHDEWDQS